MDSKLCDLWRLRTECHRQFRIAFRNQSTNDGATAVVVLRQELHDLNTAINQAWAKLARGN